jgi:DNA-binding response OmpR family regulator
MDHILLVEDDAALRELLLRGFQGQSQLDVRGAATLRDAVRALDERAPSLIVLDLELPDGSGLELLPELGFRGLRPPIVVITGNASRFQAEFGELANIDVLLKPFEPAALRRLVLERLSRAKSEVPTSAFTVADYLQLAGMARRSVALTISEGGQRLGQVLVQDGAPRWAEDQLGAGEVAFRRLAMLQRAEVSCRPLAMPVPKTNLTGSLEQLLIDAARDADESKRRKVRPSKPPPAAARGAASESSRPTVAPPDVPAPPLPSPPPLPSRARAAPPKPSGATAIGLAAFQAKNADALPAQEKIVTLNKVNRPNLPQLLTLDPSLKAVARADRQGSVLETTGEMDAETTCAVVTMALRQIADATAELGIGRPSAWHVSAGSSTWYVVQCRDELVLGAGGVNKNPIATLRKLAKSCGVGA